jgi:hypothetical protein
MDNHKSELLETLGIIFKFAGTLAGEVVVCSKEVSDCVKNIMAEKPENKSEPSTKTTESIKNQTKKKFAEMEKKKTTAKQAKLKERTEKFKPPAIKTKKSNIKPNAPSAKS